jgi:hypothetical protein
LVTRIGNADLFFCAFAVQCRRSLHFWQIFFSALSAPLRDYRAKGILVAACRAASSRLCVEILQPYGMDAV